MNIIQIMGGSSSKTVQETHTVNKNITLQNICNYFPGSAAADPFGMHLPSTPGVDGREDIAKGYAWYIAHLTNLTSSIMEVLDSYNTGTKALPAPEQLDAVQKADIRSLRKRGKQLGLSEDR